MDNLTIRPALNRDIATLVSFIIAMLRDMESVGGRPLASSDYLHTVFEEQVRSTIVSTSNLYIVAEQGPQAIGMLHASRFPLDQIFQNKIVLHIHAVYVDTPFRRIGVARQLMERAMGWGRERDCVEVKLNVLAANPALYLYQAMGFVPFQVEMRRRL